jgi:RHS repeat-associated protein
LVFGNIPRSPMAYFSPAISFSMGPGNANHIEIDHVSVSAFYLLEGKQQWATLFREDFGQLNEKNDLGSRGCRTKGEMIVESNQKETGLKHLSIKPFEGEQVTVVKTINVPVDFPFDVSDKTFKIRYNDDMYDDAAAFDVYPGHGGSGGSSNNFYSSSTNTFSNRTQRISRTSELFNTYYIYSFDGKLLAEYDHNGNCIRDYVYFGNLLLAEYKPQTNEFFYYMPDQVNSTRIILNENREVVFSEAYGPYGDVQKTWINTYDPKLKFSRKEREGYSDLDYFGARYFDHKNYRFNSLDPIINREEALYNPQLWNLYAYCRNNPITYFDPDGRISESMGKYEYTVAEHFGKASNDPVSKMFLLGAVAFNVGYFAGPEIISAIGAAGAKVLPALKKMGDKISRIFENLSRNRRTFEKIYKNLEKQMQRDGVKSIFKALKSHQKALLEHMEKLKDGLKYESQVKATINRVKIAIKATKKFIKDKGLK